jgi:biopolymer transport protein TolR
MAFHLRDDQDDVMGDINVTPLVDVMLVLLIIFMVATPMLHQGIQVALPRAEARNLPLKVQDPIVLSINRDGQVFLRDARVQLSELADRIKERLAGRPDDTVFLKGDRGVPYGRVIEVLDRLHRIGIVHVGMVTERPPKGARS